MLSSPYIGKRKKIKNWKVKKMSLHGILNPQSTKEMKKKNNQIKETN